MSSLARKRVNGQRFATNDSKNRHNTRRCCPSRIQRTGRCGCRRRTGAELRSLLATHDYYTDAHEGNPRHGRCQTSRFACPHLTPSCGEFTGKAPIASLVIIARLLQRRSDPNRRQRAHAAHADVPVTPYALYAVYALHAVFEVAGSGSTTINHINAKVTEINFSVVQKLLIEIVLPTIAQ